MAKTLTNISKFSSDATNLAIAHCLQGGIERNEFKTRLREILLKLKTAGKDDDDRGQQFVSTKQK